MRISKILTNQNFNIISKKEFQELQNELRVVAQMHRELAERMMMLTGQIGKIVYEVYNHSKSDSNPYFPENDYGTVVTQINMNPNLKKKRKWKTESWPSYAIRISKLVGWSVDEQALKTGFALYFKH